MNNNNNVENCKHLKCPSPPHRNNNIVMAIWPYGYTITIIPIIG